MKFKQPLLDILIISFAAVFPHLGFIPLFGYTLPIIIVIGLRLKYRGEKFSDIGFSFKKFSFKALLVGAVSALLILGFMQLVFFPILNKFVTFSETDVGIYDFIRQNIWSLIFMITMGCLVGGLYEEIVFHGFIFTKLEGMIKGKGRFWISFVITCIIFAGYHIQLGWAGVINSLVVGAVYQALFLYHQRNLWYSICCHGVYNTLVMVLVYLEYL